TVQDVNPDTNTTMNRIVIANIPVSVRNYERWSLNTALGREWYLLQPAYAPGRHWRVGFDTGGRWGASRMEFNDFANPPGVDYRKRYDVFGAFFISLHTDFEFPVTSACWFVTGLRAEWNYDWSSIMHDTFPAKGGDLQDVNIQLNTGF